MMLAAALLSFDIAGLSVHDGLTLSGAALPPAGTSVACVYAPVGRPKDNRLCQVRGNRVLLPVTVRGVTYRYEVFVRHAGCFDFATEPRAVVALAELCIRDTI
jgi:hypothetical protein